MQLKVICQDLYAVQPLETAFRIKPYINSDNNTKYIETCKFHIYGRTPIAFHDTLPG